MQYGLIQLKGVARTQRKLPHYVAPLEGPLVYSESHHHHISAYQPYHPLHMIYHLVLVLHVLLHHDRLV